MRRILAFLILLPLAVVVVALAVANRHALMLSLDPFNTASPAISLSAPVYVVIFATFALGVLLGGIATWFGQGRWRREARERRAEAARWRSEAMRLREREAERAGLPAPIERAA
ncbi:MAG: lipopolysaccharide assembly protein LapA domain-containing protein [Pseudomonadota bacterium]|nr:lipopolysaccharide assembly protein LapA domain-containing protein [Pseudomonadota bacterium]